MVESLSGLENKERKLIIIGQAYENTEDENVVFARYIEQWAESTDAPLCLISHHRNMLDFMVGTITRNKQLHEHDLGEIAVIPPYLLGGYKASAFRRNKKY